MATRVAKLATSLSAEKEMSTSSSDQRREWSLSVQNLVGNYIRYGLIYNH